MYFMHVLFVCICIMNKKLNILRQPAYFKLIQKMNALQNISYKKNTHVYTTKPGLDFL